MPRISQNLRERAIGMLNAGMTMNTNTTSTGCSTRAIRHLGQHFQATVQGVRNIDHVTVVTTAIFGTPIGAIASKLPQLLLQTPMVHITIVYLPKMCAIACARVGYRDEILARHVIPLFQNNANNAVFKHDNATSHTARDTVNFLRANNVAFITVWPAKSPDLNPIEYHSFGIIWIGVLDAALFHRQTLFS